MKTRRNGMKRSFDAAYRASDASNGLISSSPRSANLSYPASSRFLFGPLRGLGEFLDDALALEPGDMVDEQDAVEVVDLMLDAGREQAFGLRPLRLAVE